MNPNDAAKTIYSALQHAPWFTAVGIGVADGQECLYVYVKRIPTVKVEVIENIRKSLPVKLLKTGSFKPALVG